MNQQRPLKVLHVITVFSVGGATEGMISLAEGLQAKGYEVHLATGYHVKSEGSLFDDAKQHNLSVKVFASLVKEVNPIKDLKALLDLHRYIKQEKFDIVHTHTAKAGILGRIAAKQAGVPVIFHTLHLLSFHKHQAWPFRHLFRLLETYAERFTDKITSVSQTMIDVHLKAGIGKPEKYILIRSAFNDLFFKMDRPSKEVLKKKYAAKFGFAETDFIVTKISRVSKLKGHKFLIEAVPKVLEQIPNAKFLLVGSGDYMDEVQAFIREKGLEKSVIMTGLIPPVEVPDMIAASDIVIQTSLHEGLARVLQQAMALKLPIISFDLDGSWEVIKDGENGFLINASPITSKTIDDIADRIIRIAKNPELQKQMGEKSFAMAYPEFTIPHLVDEMEKVMIEVVRRKGIIRS